MTSMIGSTNRKPAFHHKLKIIQYKGGKTDDDVFRIHR